MNAFKLVHYREGRTTPIMMVLCTDNEFHDASANFTHKTWKTEAGAERYAADRWNTEHATKFNGGVQYCQATELPA